MIRRFIEWVKALVNIARTRDELGFYQNATNSRLYHLREELDTKGKDLANRVSSNYREHVSHTERLDRIEHVFGGEIRDLKSRCDEEEKRVRHMIWQAKQRGRLK